MLLVAPVLEPHRVPIDRRSARDDDDRSGPAEPREHPAVDDSRPSRTWTTARGSRRSIAGGTRGSRGLLDAFHRRTGCPVLVNTSFNVRGEPIVCTPEDAYRCFLATEMDALVLGNVIVLKQDAQTASIKRPVRSTWPSFTWTERMQWSDVVAPPPHKVLRQFAVLCLVVFGGDWRRWTLARQAPRTAMSVIAAAGVLVGLAGVVSPPAIRWVYSGWMIAVFPIGWTISRLILAALFYLVFTPVALVFRLVRRDALHLQQQDASSHWAPKAGAASSDQYFRQF